MRSEEQPPEPRQRIIDEIKKSQANLDKGIPPEELSFKFREEDGEIVESRVEHKGKVIHAAGATAVALVAAGFLTAYGVHRLRKNKKR